MNNELTRFFPNENELMLFGSQLAASLSPGIIFYLYGPLGAGKTTFVRGFLRGLGYQDKVKSPTYTLVEPYFFEDKKIFHFDFYRINDPRELQFIGLDEYFAADAICLIEWPEKALSVLPPPDLSAHIAIAGQGREMRLEWLPGKLNHV
jgi:tRNA threonylcarbamoyladenosine biosynthesis protein TsaE